MKGPVGQGASGGILQQAKNKKPPGHNLPVQQIINLEKESCFLQERSVIYFFPLFLFLHNAGRGLNPFNHYDREFVL